MRTYVTNVGAVNDATELGIRVVVTLPASIRLIDTNADKVFEIE